MAEQPEPAFDRNTLTCTICGEPPPPHTVTFKIQPLPTDEQAIICPECVRGMFSSALEREHSWPVTWGRAMLDPHDFVGVFDTAFLAAWDRREREYRTPPLRRVYCSSETSAGGCGKFVGELVAGRVDSLGLELEGFRVCECGMTLCVFCGGRRGFVGEQHDCRPGEEVEMERRMKAVEGLERGKDYQLCPADGCGRIIELAEACNAMRCRCGADFCYLCGWPAEEGSKHWMRKQDGGSGCPKFGGKDSESFETPRDHDEDEDDEDEDSADGDEELQMVQDWERGGGGLTSFNFQRWTWNLALSAGTVYQEQLRIMRGQHLGPDRPAIVDIRPVLQAMLTWTPLMRTEISAMHWNAIVQAENQEGATLRWLMGLWWTASNRGNLRELIGGSLPSISFDHVFNVADEANRKAGAQWARHANSVSLEHGADNPLNDEENPGVALFDVGPDDITATTPAEYNIRDMEIFNGLDGLEFYRLTGNALLVTSKHHLVDEIDEPHVPLRRVGAELEGGQQEPAVQQPAQAQNNPQLERAAHMLVERARVELQRRLAQDRESLRHDIIELWKALLEAFERRSFLIFLYLGYYLALPMLYAFQYIDQLDAGSESEGEDTVADGDQDQADAPTNQTEEDNTNVDHTEANNNAEVAESANTAEAPEAVDQIEADQATDETPQHRGPNPLRMIFGDRTLNAGLYGIPPENEDEDSDSSVHRKPEEQGNILSTESHASAGASPDDHTKQTENESRTIVGSAAWRAEDENLVDDIIASLKKDFLGTQRASKRK